MKKKILSFFLLVLILISFPSLTGAKEDVGARLFKVQYLIDNKIVEGRTTDLEGQVDYALDKNITRAEVSKILVHLLDLEDVAKALEGTVLAFSDVKADHWALGYINALTSENSDPRIARRLLVGFPDGRFLPEKDISYEELATILVRVCKKDLTEEDEKNAIWATSYMAWAEELGLLEDISFDDSRKRVTREEAFVMVYNARQILKMNGENMVDFGEKLAIVSKFQAGILEVNQDSKKLYKIDEKTIFAYPGNQLDLYGNIDYVGSLIRFIANKDGHVERLMVLGNPRDLALENRWTGLGENIVSARDNTYFTADYTGSYELTVAGVKAEINKDTLLFAADKDKNILGPIKDPGQVFEQYVKYRRPLKDVYMAYNDYGRHKEAKLIVFNKVDLFQGKEELRRITTPPTSDFKFTAESMIEGQEKVFDLMEAGVFPGDLDLDFMDVIFMRFDSYEAAKLTEKPRKLIDYGTAPVYRVHAYDGKSLVLRDQFNRELPLSARQTAIFKPGQLKEGDHVQVLIMPPQFIVDLIGQDKLMDLDLEDLDLNKINIRELLKDIRIEDIVIALESIHSVFDFQLQAMAVSIVPDDLRGALPLGFRTGEKISYVKDLYEDTVVLAEKVDGIYVNHKTYKYFQGDRLKLKFAKDLDLEIIYDETYIGPTLPYIHHVEFYLDYEKLAGLTNEVLEELIRLSAENDVDLDRLVDLVHEIENLNVSEEIKEQIKYLINLLFLSN